jgi:hypothetical protein
VKGAGSPVKRPRVARFQPIVAPGASRRDCAQTMVIGVPTGISRDSFRIDSFGMRMQP